MLCMCYSRSSTPFNQPCLGRNSWNKYLVHSQLEPHCELLIQPYSIDCLSRRGKVDGPPRPHRLTEIFSRLYCCSEQGQSTQIGAGGRWVALASLPTIVMLEKPSALLRTNGGRGDAYSVLRMENGAACPGGMPRILQVISNLH